LLKSERELGLTATVVLALGGAIGFEIFVLLDYAFYELAGANLVIAVLMAGIVNLFIMLSYCELGASIPELGGEYTYVKVAYGGFIAFVSGCFRWLASVFVAALAAVCFTRQLGYLLQIAVPMYADTVFQRAPLIAVIVVLFMAALEIKGTRRSGSAIVFAVLAIFAIFIAVAPKYELIPMDSILVQIPEGADGILRAVVYIFPMFFGMRAVIAAAAKIRNPGKNIPKGILLTAVLVTLLYFAVAYIAVSVVPRGDSTQEAEVPFLNLAAERIMPGIGGVMIAVGGIVACLSALGTSLAVQSSIARGMSRDGYLPRALLSTHRRFGTPYVAVAAGSAFVAILSFSGGVESLGYAASFGSLVVFSLVNLSLLRLRKKKPYMERPFKTPMYPFVPLAGIAMTIILLAFPVISRDTNAVQALTSSVGLTALTVLTYYLRMIGRQRLQIAVGGIGVSIGVSLALLAVFGEGTSVSTFFPWAFRYILIAVSLVTVLAGLLNMIVDSG